MMPMIAARGMEVAGWPSETPPTKTTASMPSRRTVIKGRTTKAHFPALVRPSTSTASARQHDPDTWWGKDKTRTLAIESSLELDPPLSLRLVHLEHRETDDEDEDGGNQRKDSLP
jgi:ketosteroid isomerase-like protein